MRDLEKILNIPSSDVSPADLVSQTTTAIETIKKNYDIVFADGVYSEDFEYVRDSLKGMIDTLSRTAEKLNLIALDDEKASSFSALAQLTTTILNAQKTLVEMHRHKKKFFETKAAVPKTSEQPAQINIQNAAFVGTTQDLKNYLKKIQESDVIEN